MQTGDDARGGRDLRELFDVAIAGDRLARLANGSFGLSLEKVARFCGCPLSEAVTIRGKIMRAMDAAEEAIEAALSDATLLAEPPAPGPSVEETEPMFGPVRHMDEFDAKREAFDWLEAVALKQPRIPSEQITTEREDFGVRVYWRNNYPHAVMLTIRDSLNFTFGMGFDLFRLAVTKTDAGAAPVTVSGAAEGKWTTDASRDKDDLPNRSEATWRALNVAAIEAEALLARLDELDGDALTAAGVRDYYRHVDPVAARLRQALFDAAVDGTGSAAALAGTPAGDGLAWRNSVRDLCNLTLGAEPASMAAQRYEIARTLLDRIGRDYELPAPPRPVQGGES